LNETGVNATVRGLRTAFSRGANVFMFARAAPFYARYTLRYHLPAEMLLGSFSGIVMLADILARKTLGAPDWMVTVQASVPMMMFVLAMVWRDLLDRVDRRKTLLFSGFLGKGVFLLGAFVVSPLSLLMLIVVWAVVESAFVPVRNSIFRSNYDDRVRGRLFGGVVSMTNLVLVAVNLGAAWILTRWESSYRILFPVAALLGIAAHVIYSRVRVRGRDRAPADAPVARPLRTALTRAFTTTVRILREDRAFRAYERNFFIYGMAFLMNLPLVVFLMVDELKLAYDQASLGRFVVSQLIMILLAPIVGRLLDKSHPAKLMSFGCLLLAVHAALLFFTHDFWLLCVSYGIFGVAMTGVIMSWNLGPVQFAPTKEAATDYMAVHVTLTGLRAMLGPVLALTAKEWLGLRAGFLVSAGLYALSGILMLRITGVRRESEGPAGPGSRGA
jgi:MFS family permease